MDAVKKPGNEHAYNQNTKMLNQVSFRIAFLVEMRKRPRSTVYCQDGEKGEDHEDRPDCPVALYGS